jgi:hypothetical protein
MTDQPQTTDRVLKSVAHRYMGMTDSSCRQLSCSCGWVSTVFGEDFRASAQYREWRKHRDAMDRANP